MEIGIRGILAASGELWRVIVVAVFLWQPANAFSTFCDNARDPTASAIAQLYSIAKVSCARATRNGAMSPSRASGSCHFRDGNAIHEARANRPLARSLEIRESSRVSLATLRAYKELWKEKSRGGGGGEKRRWAQHPGLSGRRGAHSRSWI